MKFQETKQGQILKQINDDLAILRLKHEIELATVAKIEEGTELSLEEINNVLHGRSDNLKSYQLVRDFIECQLFKLGEVN